MFICRTRLAGLFAGVLCGLSAACFWKAAAPELPKIELTGFQPGVRAVIGDALRKAQAEPRNAEAVARLGMALHAHNRFLAAVVCYRRACVLDPKRFEYFYYWGAALSADGKYAEAVDPLVRAVALNPAAIPVRLKLADALFETGRRDEARQQYRAAIQLNADVAAAHYGLSRTLQGADAITELRKALELFPRYGAAQFALAAEYRKAGRLTDAAQTLAGYELNRTMAPPLDDPVLGAVFALNAGATGLVRQAQALEREGRLEEAAAVCERAVAEYPKFGQAWIDLISLYGRLNKPDQVERVYREAIALEPNVAEAYYNYGVFCFDTGRFEAAKAAFNETTKLDPRNADAWNNLGSVVERTGALKAAAESYRRAVSERPEFPLAHFHLGRIYANDGRYSEAIAEFEKSLQPQGDQTATYLYALAATHARAGHRQQSLALFEKARDAAAGRGQTELVASIERDMRTLGAGR